MKRNYQLIQMCLIMSIIMSFVLVSGCLSQSEKGDVVVKKGDMVSVNYIGKLQDGSVFDTSIKEVAQDAGIYNPGRKYEPLSFVTGQGMMIAGFDEAVIGMRVGENKTVTIPPEMAYGYHSEEKVMVRPAEDFVKANITPKIGEMVSDNYGRPWKITKINAENVTLDCNHDLVEKTLVFTIEIVSISNK